MTASDLIEPNLGNRRTYNYSRLLMEQFLIEVWNKAKVEATVFNYEHFAGEYIGLIEDYRKNVHKFANVYLDVDKMIEHISLEHKIFIHRDRLTEFELFAKSLIYN